MVLLYFMDGVKYEMMQKYMPFTASMNVKPIQSEFGYSCACHATMYTSRYIEEHGTWFIWKKGDHSPYKWVDKVPGLKYLNFLPIKLAIGKATRLFSKNSSYSGVPCLVNLPLKYWSSFELCDDHMWNDPAWKKEIPNLFTIMDAEKVPHHVVALHRGTGPQDAFLEEEQVDYANDEFVYYFIGFTDNMMHKYGETGIEVQEYLGKVDEFIQETYMKAKQLHDDVTLISFSDHGHIDLQLPHVDINDYFKAEGLNVNNYLHLIESNFARFWFRNDRERSDVDRVLRTMYEAGLGYVIDEQCRREYHLNVDPAEHGDLIFYLAAPHEFTKTIWGFGHSVKSGHGYEPTLPKHLGFFASNKKLCGGRDRVFLVDILPTVLEQLAIADGSYSFRGENVICTADDDAVGE